MTPSQLPDLNDLAHDDPIAIAQRFEDPPATRQVYCNRTLNFRAVKAVGYDMDYTLVHYKVRDWEGRAYAHLRQRLEAAGWPVHALEFEPDRVMRGLVIDKRKGNLVKSNRFGYIKQAMHGTRMLGQDELREVYGRTLVELVDTQRWMFLNTLFEISEGCMYAQLVDLYDQGRLAGLASYEELYRKVRYTLDRAHLEGALKAEILAQPDLYVELDPDLPMALLDQRESGKKLLMVTNSEWSYTRAMMGYSFDRYLPEGMSWRDLFDVIIVSSRKPAFFQSIQPLYEVVNDEGLLRPYNDNLVPGKIYAGGSAEVLERSLGLDGDQIAYVGDHMLSDAYTSKKLQQWRTVAILRELEEEIDAVESWRKGQALLDQMMAEKERLEHAFSQLRVLRQRQRSHHGPVPVMAGHHDLQDYMNTLRERLVDLDSAIAPLVAESNSLHNPYWGLMMRTGNDKSLLARMVERHADAYTSRVSNFAWETPYVFLRSLRGTLPHDV